MVTQLPIHKANIFQSVRLWFHQPESQCCTSKLSLSVSVSLSVCPPSLLHFLWVTDLKWQIRLVISLCDVTPSLADRQPAVT